MHVVGNLLITVTLLSVARTTYPGGSAIQSLHYDVPPDENVHVYVDRMASQSGVTRFTQINDRWIYNVTGSDLDAADVAKFTHLMIEARSKYSKNLKPFFKSYDILKTVEEFSHIHVNYLSFPPFKIKTKPVVFILQRKDFFGLARKKVVHPEVQDEFAIGEKIESVFDLEDDAEAAVVTDQDESEALSEDEAEVVALVMSEAVELDAESTKLSTRALVDSLIRSKRLRASLDSVVEQLPKAPETGSSELDSDAIFEEKDTASGQEILDDPESSMKEVGETKEDRTREAKSVPSALTNVKFKNLRAKTNSLAFDALHDALLEEELSKAAPPSNTDQYTLIMPSTTGGRQYQVPNLNLATVSQAITASSTKGGSQVVDSSASEGAEEVASRNKKIKHNGDRPNRMEVTSLAVDDRIRNVSPKDGLMVETGDKAEEENVSDAVDTNQHQASRRKDTAAVRTGATHAKMEAPGQVDQSVGDNTPVENATATTQLVHVSSRQYALSKLGDHDIKQVDGAINKSVIVYKVDESMLLEDKSNASQAKVPHIQGNGTRTVTSAPEAPPVSRPESSAEARAVVKTDRRAQNGLIWWNKVGSYVKEGSKDTGSFNRESPASKAESAQSPVPKPNTSNSDQNVSESSRSTR